MFQRFRKKDRTPTPATSDTSLTTQPQSGIADASGASAEVVGDKEFGLKVVTEGEDATIDIIAVHGLNGHREKTWTAKNGKNWLQDFLPNEISRARILTYGYDSRTHSSEQLTRQTLYGHSVTLVSTLSMYRRRTKTERRPIIFLAHSLGGIVVKSALIHSNMASTSHNEHLKAIKLSTHGIMFFGTPHQGGNHVAWGKILVNVASLFQHTSSNLLEHLEKDSEWLETQLEQYKSISADFATLFCFESYPTVLKSNVSIMIVPKSSAVVPGATNAESIEIRKDHLTMVKFGESSDDDFQTVVGHMDLMSQNSVEKISGNWERWDEISGLGPNYWMDQAAPPIELEYNRNPIFTGREIDLNYIHTFLLSQKDNPKLRKPLVIHGAGGLGKSQLVREYIYAHALDFSCVLWINASSLQSTQNSFLGFAQRLVTWYARTSKVPLPYPKISRYLNLTGLVDDNGNIRLDEENVKQIVTAIHTWLTQRRGLEWLCVFDNVDDLETFQIAEYLPPLEFGNIIVTSRRPGASRLGQGWALPAMAEEDSVSLLQKAYGEAGEFDSSEARSIIRALGYLPLAIDQAGALLNGLSKPITAFLPLVEANFNHTFSKKPPTAVWQYGNQTVTSTWEISLQAAQDDNPKAGYLFTLCSFLSNDAINPTILSQGLPETFPDATTVDDALLALFSYSLASRKKDSDSFSIHPLVHTWSRERLPIRDAEVTSDTALRLVASAIDRAEPHSLDDFREYILHIRRCSQLWLELHHTNTPEVEAEILDSWETFATVFQNQGQYTDAKDMFERALVGYEKVLVHDHADTLRVVQNLGMLYHSRGKLDEAENMLERALAGYDKGLEPDHKDTLGVVQNLGLLYHSRGKLDEAENMLERALAGYDKGLEPDHKDTLGVVQNLGLLYHSRGKLDEAEKIWKRALAGFEKVLEPDHRDTLLVVQNLGMLYLSRGKLDEAEKMWKRALARYEKVLEPDHRDTLLVVQNLGALYYSRGKLDEAEKMWKRALAGYEKVLEPDHRDILTVVQNLGLLYHSRDKLNEAEKMWERALAGYEKVLEPDHRDTLGVVQNLGLLYYSRGKLDQAEKMWKRALAGCEKVLEPGHADTLRVVQNLGMLYLSRGKLDEAEKMWKRALAGYEKVLEPGHADTLRVVQNLGALHHSRGRLDEAEKMWEQALAGFEKVLEPDHRDTLGVVQNLGMVYRQQGKFQEAKNMLQRVLTSYEESLGPEHIETLSKVSELGMLLFNSRELTEAEGYLRRAAEGYSSIADSQDRELPDALYFLGELYEEQSKLGDSAAAFERSALEYGNLYGPEDEEALEAAERLRKVQAKSSARTDNPLDD